MFKILSKESNIFSIPIFIGILLIFIIVFNIFEFNLYTLVTSNIAFIGIALGYFTFNTVGLNKKTNFPLFIYTILNIALFPKTLDIGIAWTILTNSLLIYLLSHNDESKKNRGKYLLVGSLLATNYIFLPTIWPMSIFFFLHIISTSKKILLQLFRFFMGGALICIAYFSLAFFLNFNEWNADYLPNISWKYSNVESLLISLIPFILLFFYSVLDYFKKYNSRSGKSKFVYQFLLLFIITQLTIIVFYMGLSTQYLLIIALPISIIICRGLSYIKKESYQEITLWILIISLATYYLLQNYTF